MINVTARDKQLIPNRLYLQQGDSGAGIVCFSIPRHYDNVDLSKCSAAILVSGKVGSTSDKIVAEVDNVLKLETEEETVKLIWTVSGYTTKEAGELMYQIVFYDNDNQVVWHTVTASFTVRESIGVDDDIYAAYPSLLQQWEANMKAQAEESRGAIAQAQAQAAAAKTSADNAGEFAKQSQSSAGVSTEQAQSASLNKDATEQNKAVTLQKAQEVEQAKQEALTAKARCEELERRVVVLMSTDTRSYLFKTLLERDMHNDFRHCDRCSVMETRADYIYDTLDIDGNEISPEWIQTSSWDSTGGVSWDMIEGKPIFSLVATTGDYNSLSNKPNLYRSFITLPNGNWDYSLSDKAVITVVEPTPINITNLYNGAVGLIKVYGGELILPAGSKKSIDFDYITATGGGHYTYTFLYDGTSLCWSRTVCVNG